MRLRPLLSGDWVAISILLVFLLTSPLLVYAALRAVQGRSNRVIDWLPKTYTETDDLAWFREHFAGDQFVIVSWAGCRLGDDPQLPNAQQDDPRIERLAQLLETNGVVSDSSQETQYVQSATTGRRLLDRLTAAPTSLPYETAVKRLQGFLIGPGGRQTCVVAMLSDDAIGDFRAVLGRRSEGWFRFSRDEGVLYKAIRQCGIPLDAVHLGGPPVDSVAIDEEGERTIYRLASLAAVVGLLLAWWSLRSIRLTLIVFACGLLSAIGSLAAVWITGERTDAFSLSMPALVYVLAISGAVHLVKYYLDALEEKGPKDAPMQAIADGWLPTLLCSVTTAFGLLSLCTSDLTPVRKFGIYSSLGVMLMLVSLFVFLPAALRIWPERQRRSGHKRWEGLDNFWERFGGWVIRHYKAVTFTCIVIVIGAGYGITHVRTTVDLMKLFDGDARIRQDYQWLESNVGRLVPMEVVLRFDRTSIRRGDATDADRQRVSLLERVEAVTEVQQTIESTFGSRGMDVTGRSMSARTFIGALPKRGRSVRTIARRSAANKKLNSSFEQLCNTGYLAVDQRGGTELWRISVRVAAFKDVDYGEFSNQLRDVVDPVVAKHNGLIVDRMGSATAEPIDDNPKTPVFSAVYTGVVPIVYKAQRALLDSLIESTFWSFITITPLVIIVSRGFWAGATAMLPNTLPVLMVFGGMGWLGVPVAIGSMMSAGIALGVAVDDTIHFLMWFRSELDETADRGKACLAAYRRCATPTLQAALISGLGLSVFALSTFTPTMQFGLLMLTILLTGVVAELILLPALLAGPLGRAFKPHKRKPKH
ncbi:MAG: MMPL family transporter [Pirellulaceae bacterium]|nr:MMPL family transporter [Pirellulaceae bacterium]